MIRKIEIKAREKNVENFCPVCGMHNSGTQHEEIKPCKHLLFVYLNLVEESLMYIRDDIKKFIDIDDEWGDLDGLRTLPLENAILFEEYGTGPDNSRFLIGYEYCE